MSKLQALAAARKKKLQDKRAADSVDSVRETLAATGITTSMKENIRPRPHNPISPQNSLSLSDSPTKRQRLIPSKTASNDSPSTAKVSAHPARKSDADPPRPSQDEDRNFQVSWEIEEAGPVSNFRQPPSAFARTLIGPAPDLTSLPLPASYPIPYTKSSSFAAEAFLKPSPDDIVLAAQAKGSRFSGKKVVR
jgi:elongation factor 1 alpha-like protein